MRNQRLGNFVKKHGSTILTCTSITGVVATSVVAAKSTTKASKLLQKAKEEKGDDLTKMEILQVAGPAYIPALALGAVTIGSIISIGVLNKYQNKSMTAAYMTLNETFKNYRAKVDDIYGEGSDEEIQEKMVEDRLRFEDQDAVRLFYDEFSDRYFESTYYNVQKAEYEVNRTMMKRDYAYLNEWYEELGELDILTNGYALGWTTYQCMEMYWQPWIDFDHYKFTTEDGRECTGICIVQQPVLDFDNWC